MKKLLLGLMLVFTISSVKAIRKISVNVYKNYIPDNCFNENVPNSESSDVFTRHTLNKIKFLEWVPDFLTNELAYINITNITSEFTHKDVDYIKKIVYIKYVNVSFYTED